MSNQVKISNEVMQKLRGFSVVTNTVKHTVEIEGVPEEFLPVFTLTNFTVKEAKVLREQMEPKAKVKGKSESKSEDEVSDVMDEFVRIHIKDWSNLYDLSTGEVFGFKADDKGFADKEVYELLPQALKVSIIQFLYSLVNAIN
jgi:molybdopterin-biosynthesis enzyme MoeA-like protein